MSTHRTDVRPVRVTADPAVLRPDIARIGSNINQDKVFDQHYQVLQNTLIVFGDTKIASR